MNPTPHGPQAHQPDVFDLFLADVLHEVANPAPTPQLESRLATSTLSATEGTHPMQIEFAAQTPTATNVLHFHTLDRTAGRRMSPQSIGVAVLFNIAALLLLTIQMRTHILVASHREMLALVEPSVPPPAVPRLKMMGGGGGSPGAAPVSKGNPPKFAAEQLNPPKAPPLIEPKIKIDPTVDVQQDLKMAHVDVPNFGMPNSPLVGTSLGNGKGTGIGSGLGAGLGAGTGSGAGSGVRRIGGPVSRPVVLFAPEPEFSDEARKAKVSGNVLVYLQVDVHGNPTHIRIVRGIGLGLDEKAIEAVSRYKFRAAMENGHPVLVEMQVDVNFQIF